MEAVGAIAGPVLGGILGSNASGDAADAQVNAANNRLALDSQIYNQQYKDLAPYRELGISMLNPLKALVGQSSTQTPQSVLQSDPSYQWRMDQGMKALQSSALSKGLLQSGRTAKDILELSQGLASQEYGNVFNRYAALANTGQAAVNSGNAAGAAYGASSGNAMEGAGNARASGYIGSSNSINNSIGQGYNNYMQNQWMKRLPTNTVLQPSEFYRTAFNYDQNYG